MILFTTIEPRLIFLPHDYDFEALRVPNLAVNPAPSLRWLRDSAFLVDLVVAREPESISTRLAAADALVALRPEERPAVRTFPNARRVEPL